MYRSLSILKDTMITDKRISGSGSINSNVGQASSLDLFKIWSQPTSGSIPLIETSRVLIHVDLEPIRSLTGSFLDIANSSFKCYLSLKDIYGGQTTPSNFTLSLLPMSKAWDEGRGSDITAFRDLDAANWVTASNSTGAPVLWAITGANDGGSDYVNGYEVKQVFARGDEDLYMDVTTLVSATLVGNLPDNGWRLSYSSSFERDDNSYFVKRFGSRHTTNQQLHPKLIVKFSDALQDDTNQAIFGQNNTIRTYNVVKGQYRNFVSGVTDITGSNSLNLLLVASKSINITTSSWQQNFSASITYTTQSTTFFSQSFTASQTVVGTIQQTGFYGATVFLDPQTATNLNTFLGTDKTAVFQSYWTSLDGTTLYSSGSFITFKKNESTNQVVTERNFVANLTNLKNEYNKDQVARLRFFVQDRNTELPAFHIPTPTTSLILNQVNWRLVDAFNKTIIIPFDSDATKLSSDSMGMYFDLYVKDLSPNCVYELEFRIIEAGVTYYIANEGFRFKVVV
jgi:hypothetical protein